MRITTIAVTMSLLLVTAAMGKQSTNELRDAARQAAAEDQHVVAAAVGRLRDAGPAGLEALFDEHREILAAQARANSAPQAPAWARVKAAIDAVAQQKDAHVSRLYWYTDLEKAKQIAATEGKPILSLRLLGTLDSDLSCANSRFFRSALYANQQISTLLRNRFVLHWASERPAPRITIDFGDGRVVQRTITGNSAHYVLSSDGRPIDVMPGLYGPAMFRELLLAAAAAAEQYDATCAQASERAAQQELRAWHARRWGALAQAWQRDAQWLAEQGLAVPELSLVPAVSIASDQPRPPTAVEAARLAMTKTIVERPMLQLVMPDADALRQELDDQRWLKLAERYIRSAWLDESSLELIRRQDPPRFSDALVRRFHLSMALDTVRNQYLLRPTIHRWFADGAAVDDLDALNQRVYAELFLTPADDPWLGLRSGDVYSALEGGGVTE